MMCLPCLALMKLSLIPPVPYGGSIFRMKSSWHVRLFVPQLAVCDLLRTSLDPPFILRAFAPLAQLLWFVCLQKRFPFYFSSTGRGNCDHVTETNSLTPAAFGVS